MAWGNVGPFVDGIKAAWRMRLHHMTTFSHVHGFCDLEQYFPPHNRSDCSRSNETFNQWLQTPLNYSAIDYWTLPLSLDSYTKVPHTIYDYIRDHLGYRFELKSAVFDSAQIGKNFKVSFSLINYGFSTLLNPRNVYAVLVDSAKQIIAAQSLIQGVDPRKWQPYLPGDPSYRPLLHTISSTFLVPPTLSPGSFLVGIFLPDPRMTVPHSASFSVRFANNDTVWWTDSQGNYGINVLGTVQLSAQRMSIV